MPSQRPSASSRASAIAFSSAEWIWDGGEPAPLDAYRLLRRAFVLKAVPKRAPLRIACDREYRLFINGRYVARGPAPNPPAHASYDELDVSAHLIKGANAIALIVHHMGAPSFQTLMGRAGLLLKLDIPGARVVSDASWRWRDAWWLHTGQLFTRMREYNEHLDMRREPLGWIAAGFADRSWKSAVPFGKPGTAPWTELEPRDIPMPEHHVETPRSLLFVGACARRVPPKSEVAAALAREPALPLPPGSCGSLAGLAIGSGEAVVDAKRQGVVIGVDWEKEVSGFPEFEIECDTAGAVIDLGYGEGLEADGHVTVHRQDNHCCDRVTLRKGRQVVRIFHHRAFRYLVMAVRGARVIFRRLEVVESCYPVEPRGAFSCSDARLTRAWEIGRRTMQLCMDQGFMDCPHRERGQYIGDALAEGPVTLYAFGDSKLTRRFLRQARWCQPADGLLEPCYPSDWATWHVGRDDQRRIPGFGFLWIALLLQYHQATADTALVRELAPTLDRLLSFFESARGENGLLARPMEWNFVDWVTLSPATELACLNLQFLMGTRAAAGLDAVLGRPAAAAKGRDFHRLSQAFEAAHWDEAAGMYRDEPGVHSIHTNALALLVLDLEAGKAKRVADGMLASKAVAIGSPYFEGYALQGLCRHGRHADALARVEEKWGPMIDAGATTFWESYLGQWSLCHAWSCEPTAMLSRDVLGVSFHAPERAVTVAPHPCRLMWAQGVAPLPCGDISLRWDVRAESFDLAISSPKDAALELDLPAGDGATLVVDGERVPATVAGGRIRVRIRGGAHQVSVVQAVVVAAGVR